MAEQLSRRFRLALAEEIKQWQKDELISPEVAESLTTRYAVPPYDSKLISISLIVGATLIGLSSMSLVALNWNHLARIVQLVMAVGAMLATYATAWLYCYEPGKSPKVGGALIELGTLLFGACIWMLTQFFNFDVNLSTGLIYWAIGTALVTLITRSQITCCLLVLQLVSLQSTCVDLFNGGPQVRFASLYIAIPILAALVWLCARVRSRAALFIVLSGALWIIGLGSGARGSGLVALGSIMFSTYFLWKDRWEWFVTPFIYLGTLAGLIGTFLITVDYALDSTTNAEIVLGLAIVPLFLIGLTPKQSSRMAIIVSFIFALLSCASGHFLANTTGLCMLSGVVLFILMAVALAVLGVKLQKMVITYAAAGLVALQILVRFCGMQFDSSILHTVAFAVVGVIVMLSGAIAETRRRRFLCTQPS